MVQYNKRKKRIKILRNPNSEGAGWWRKHKITTYAAAAYYQIPRSTLNTRLTWRRGAPGRPTVFTAEFEKRMADRLHKMERHGFPFTRKEASILISEYVRRNGIDTITIQG